MDHLFFYDWESLLRTLVIGVLAYVALIFLLRLSGNRTLSKMNAFDLIVTVSLGSTLATVLLSKEVALAEGVLAFAVLIGLQFLVTWSSVRIRLIRQVVTGEPRLLLYQGQCLRTALQQARVREDELRAAVRMAGLTSLLEAEAVVLETDGSFSIVRMGPEDDRSALGGVRGYPASSGVPDANA